jgi:hypothetical protein
MKATVLEAVTTLQSTWQNLPDVDRAEAIVRMLAAGLSGRGLADALSCSDPLIRYRSTACRTCRQRTALRF